ncbi:C40 family peptidase [Actinocorallia lasiicapitis]
MKGARFVLAASVAASLSVIAFQPAAQAAAPSPTALQDRLDALTAEAANLRIEVRQRTDASVLARDGAAFDATALAGLTDQATELAPQVDAARDRVSTMDKISDWFGGNADAEQADALAGRLSALRAQITTTSAAADSSRLDAEQAGDAVEAAEKEAADVAAELGTVKAQLTKYYTVGGVTIFGDSVAAKATRAALGKLGKPYVWAAAGPDAFDCSGLAVWAYAQAGRSGLDHYTGALYDTGTKVERSALKPGDLVFFHPDRHHMGIYIGDGKMVHAPSSGDVVKITELAERDDYNGAVRL